MARPMLPVVVTWFGMIRRSTGYSQETPRYIQRYMAVFDVAPWSGWM
ncbi:hypothetical protein ACWC9U_28095 [Streptomyces sp. 900116325]